MSEHELKKQFAKQLLRFPKEPFKAALLVFPTNTNRALKVANEWTLDPEVIDLKDQLIEELGEEAFLPSKAEFARKVWDKMDSCWDYGDFAKLSKVYAEIRGFVQKPLTQIDIGANNTTQNVMIVSDTGTDETWEQKLLKQQQALTDESK